MDAPIQAVLSAATRYQLPIPKLNGFESRRQTYPLQKNAEAFESTVTLATKAARVLPAPKSASSPEPHMATTSLLVLPNEILEKIALSLDLRSLSRLALASQFFHSLLNGYLYKRAIKETRDDGSCEHGCSTSWLREWLFYDHITDRDTSPILKRFIDYGLDVNDPVNSYGYTLLMTASMAGNTQCMRMLIDHGADVNAKTRSLSTALHDAAEGPGGVEAVTMLLEAGAIQITSMEPHDCTPSELACDPKVVKILEEWLRQTMVKEYAC